MAAPRTASFKALQFLQKSSSSTPAKRGLHITGAQSSPRLFDPTNKNAYTGLGLGELKNECRKRTLSPSGTKSELIDRITSHDGLQARAFSIMAKRIAKDQTKKPISGPSDAPPSRHFNTSRSLKAVHDSSTIDFAYLPHFDSSLDPSATAIRVPILPDVNSDEAEAVLEKYPELDSAAGGYQETQGHDTVMKPQIVSVHETMADGAHVEGLNSHFSPMSDVHDGHGPELSVDSLADLSETVRKSAGKLLENVGDKDEGTIRKLFQSFLDDVFGPGKKTT